MRDHQAVDLLAQGLFQDFDLQLAERRYGAVENPEAIWFEWPGGLQQAIPDMVKEERNFPGDIDRDGDVLLEDRKRAAMLG
jgi:hypothetical protein